jgi:hypothetical protein
MNRGDLVMDTLNTHMPMNRTLAAIDGRGGVAANVPSPSKSQNPKLLDQVREAIRMRHYSPKTEESYAHWIKRFIYFHNKRHPAEMGEKEITQFLSSLASELHVSASTQNQALNAILFRIATCSARGLATSKVSSVRKDRTDYRSF